MSSTSSGACVYIGACVHTVVWWCVHIVCAYCWAHTLSWVVDVKCWCNMLLLVVLLCHLECVNYW